MWGTFAPNTPRTTLRGANQGALKGGGGGGRRCSTRSVGTGPPSPRCNRRSPRAREPRRPLDARHGRRAGVFQRACVRAGVFQFLLSRASPRGMAGIYLNGRARASSRILLLPRTPTKSALPEHAGAAVHAVEKRRAGVFSQTCRSLAPIRFVIRGSISAGEGGGRSVGLGWRLGRISLRARYTTSSIAPATAVVTCSYDSRATCAGFPATRREFRDGVCCFSSNNTTQQRSFFIYINKRKPFQSFLVQTNAAG